MMLTPPEGGLARPADTDVSDLTASVRSGSPRWVDDGATIEIPFDPEPSEAEQELIVRRLLTADDAEESAVARMHDLLDQLTASDPLTTAVRLLLCDRLGRLDTTAEDPTP